MNNKLTMKTLLVSLAVAILGLAGCSSDDNDPSFEATTITTLSPDRGLEGTIITITGQNLDQEMTSVLMDDEVIELTDQSNVMLKAQIPLGSSVGSKTIRVSVGNTTRNFAFEILPIPEEPEFNLSIVEGYPRAQVVLFDESGEVDFQLEFTVRLNGEELFTIPQRQGESRLGAVLPPSARSGRITAENEDVFLVGPEFTVLDYDRTGPRVETIAGSLVNGYRDGIGFDARLSSLSISDIQMDSEGQIWFGEIQNATNHAIRTYHPETNTVTTLAGTTIPENSLNADFFGIDLAGNNRISSALDGINRLSDGSILTLLPFPVEITLDDGVNDPTVFIQEVFMPGTPTTNGFEAFQPFKDEFDFNEEISDFLPSSSLLRVSTGDEVVVAANEGLAIVLPEGGFEMFADERTGEDFVTPENFRFDIAATGVLYGYTTLGEVLWVGDIEARTITTLQLQGSIPFDPSAVVPRLNDIAVSPDGAFVYILHITSLKSSVAGGSISQLFSINTTSGVLELVAGRSDAPQERATFANDGPLNQARLDDGFITVSPDGKTIYLIESTRAQDLSERYGSVVRRIVLP